MTRPLLLRLSFAIVISDFLLIRFSAWSSSKCDECRRPLPFEGDFISSRGRWRRHRPPEEGARGGGRKDDREGRGHQLRGDVEVLHGRLARNQSVSKKM